MYALQQALIAISLFLWPVLFIAALRRQVISLRASRKLRMLSRVPVLPCDALPRVRRAGAVIAVEVQTSPEVIRAPLSGKDCGWYMETLTHHIHYADGNPSSLLPEETAPPPIEAGDDTGSVLITPRLGKRRLVRTGQRLVTKSAKHTTIYEKSGPPDIYGNRVVGYTSRERIAPADTRVVVIGAMAWTADGLILLDRVRGWSGIFVGGMADLYQHFQTRPARAARLVRILTVACFVATIVCVPVAVWLQTLLNH